MIIFIYLQLSNISAAHTFSRSVCLCVSVCVSVCVIVDNLSLNSNGANCEGCVLFSSALSHVHKLGCFRLHIFFSALRRVQTLGCFRLCFSDSQQCIKSLQLLFDFTWHILTSEFCYWAEHSGCVRCWHRNRFMQSTLITLSGNKCKNILPIAFLCHVHLHIMYVLIHVCF